MRPPVESPPAAARRLAAGSWAVLGVLAACTPTPDPSTGTDVVTIDFLDPQTCVDCHPAAVEQWSGSMHAYAAEDPVFLAMNARGQRETDGDLGDFCVQCHAPVAVELGLTVDGLNLGDLDPKVRGVTCAWCHSVVDVAGTHNNPLVVSLDGVMRGGISDPVGNRAHPSSGSVFHDRDRRASAELCGSCHDVVNPAGAAIERSFAEWNETVFAKLDDGTGLTCSACHMRGSDGVAAVDGPRRRVHSHAMAAVDVALTPFAQRDAQRREVEAELAPTVASILCVYPRVQGDGTDVVVELENVAAGHGFPSGAAADRRVWVELIAYRGGVPVFRSGVVDDDEPVRGRSDDPQLWELGDRLYDADGAEVHMFWEAHAYSSAALPAQTATSPLDPAWTDTHIRRVFRVEGPTPDRVTLRVRLRPFGLDLLDDLIASGDLDPTIRGAAVTLEARAARADWRAELQTPCVP
ncbi:MAG: hypothetical protein H6698_07735 [Myxococcales bacterium]|nr:hypothetical protein [Myxococcales bacterium]